MTDKSPKATVQPGKTRNRKTAVLVLLVLALGCLELHHLYNRMADENIGKDFIAYWPSGRLLLAGENPYAIEKVYAFQKSLGRTIDYPLLMYNPPWTLAFTLPFCLQNYRLSKFLWLLFNLALVIACADWTWRIYGGAHDKRIAALLIAFTFVPVLFVLNMGQTAPLILLGVVFFCYCAKHNYWILAGWALAPVAVKPHLLSLFWLALLLWILDRGQWRTALSAILTGSIVTILPLSLNASIFSHYIQALRQCPPGMWQTATIGTMLRMYYGPDKQWLQFLPLVLGTLWFLAYWRKHKKTWEWPHQLPILLSVSLMIAPHAWTMDYAVLLPAILLTAIRLMQSRRENLMKCAVIVYLAINGVALSLHFLHIDDCFSFWMLPALLVSYLILNRGLSKNLINA